MKNYLKIIQINEDSLIPKYRQLVDAIIQSISIREVRKDDILPSIHDLSVALELSKSSVEKAYNVLKQRGIIGSVLGKGFFVKTDKINPNTEQGDDYVSNRLILSNGEVLNLPELDPATLRKLRKLGRKEGL